MDVGALFEIVSGILPMPISSSTAGSFNAETNPRTAFCRTPLLSRQLKIEWERAVTVSHRSACGWAQPYAFLHAG